MPSTKNAEKSRCEPLWTTADVTHYLGVSPRKFAYMRAQGSMLAPIARIGRELRFSPAEVRAWAQAGCPPITEWEATKRREGQG
jgi:hypothetical protein